MNTSKNTGLSDAVRRAHVRRLLAEFPAPDRLRFLNDLTADELVSSSSVATPLDHPLTAPAKRRGRPPGKRAAPAQAEPPIRSPRRRGRPRSSGLTRVGALLAALRANPNRSLTELARAVFGHDDTSQLRTLLVELKKKGRVRNIGIGRWALAA